MHNDSILMPPLFTKVITRHISGLRRRLATCGHSRVIRFTAQYTVSKTHLQLFLSMVIYVIKILEGHLNAKTVPRGFCPRSGCKKVGSDVKTTTSVVGPTISMQMNCV